MASLGFIGHLPTKILGPPKFNFLLRSPQLFWSEIFRSPLKIGKGLLPCRLLPTLIEEFSYYVRKIRLTVL